MDQRRSQRPSIQADDRAEANTGLKRTFLYATAGLIAVTVVAVFLGMFYTIEEYERGILTRNGAFVKILYPGFGVKAPWIDSIPEEIDLRVKTYTWDKMETYSADQQVANLRVSVTLKPNEARLEDLYKQHRNVKNAVAELLGPIVNKDVKIVFGQYVAQKAIQERARLNLDVMNTIINGLGQTSVLYIFGVQIEDVSFSKEYERSIEERMKTEVGVAKHRQQLEYERVQADIIKTQADATAYQIKTKGDAEAEAIRAKSKAMYENPSYIQLIQAERWDGKLPTTMLPNQTIPIVEMNTRK